MRTIAGKFKNDFLELDGRSQKRDATSFMLEAAEEQQRPSPHDISNAGTQTARPPIFPKDLQINHKLVRFSQPRSTIRCYSSDPRTIITLLKPSTCPRTASPTAARPRVVRDQSQLNRLTFTKNCIRRCPSPLPDASHAALTPAAAPSICASPWWEMTNVSFDGFPFANFYKNQSTSSYFFLQFIPMGTIAYRKIYENQMEETICRKILMSTVYLLCCRHVRK